MSKSRGSKSPESSAHGRSRPVKRSAPPLGLSSTDGAAPAAEKRLQSTRSTARPARAATSWRPIVAAVVAVIALAAVAYFLTGQGSRGNQPLGEMFPSEGQQHVSEGSAIQYKSVPPTSGPHYPAPKEWGVYDQAVAPGYWVHNLEHGGVALLYNCPRGCPDVVSVGQDAFKTFPKDKYGEVKLIVTPYSGLPDGIQVAAVAWQYSKLYRGDFNRENFLAFYNGHVDRSPEDVP